MTRICTEKRKLQLERLVRERGRTRHDWTRRAARTSTPLPSDDPGPCPMDLDNPVADLGDAVGDNQRNANAGATDPDQDAVSPVADPHHVPGNDAIHYHEPFPPAKSAGRWTKTGRTTFDMIRAQLIRDEDVLRGGEVWGPFANEEEWQLAKWLIKSVGHNQAEEFLQLALVRSDEGLD